MADYLSRIGTALRALTDNSTLNGDVRTEILRLSDELIACEDQFASMIRDRVRAEIEAVSGRLQALEEGKAKADAVIFSTAAAGALGVPGAPPVSDADKERLRDIFNGADPTLFDHDGDGQPGGSLPVEDPEPEPAAEPEPTPEPAPEPEPEPEAVAAEMTIAEAEAWLDAHEVDRKGVTRRDDLRALVVDEQARLAEAAGKDTESAPA